MKEIKRDYQAAVLPTKRRRDLQAECAEFFMGAHEDETDEVFQAFSGQVFTRDND